MTAFRCFRRLRTALPSLHRARMVCVLAAGVLITACGGPGETPPLEPVIPVVPPSTSVFAISGSQILQNGRAVSFSGANALHVYGGNSDGMPSANVRIVREFIRNLNDQPITGSAIYSNANRAYFHSLRTVVEANRRNGLITILCPFGWDTLLVLGLNPSQQPFFAAYKAKMRAIAAEFKNEPDVWLEVWNEPYYWTGGGGYSDDLWLSDMQEMVDNIRSTGNQNIVLVPGSETGQTESVILSKGPQLLTGRSNILFDLHAYEKWLLSATQASITARIQALKQRGAAVVFGETSPYNAGPQMDVTTLLNAAVAERVGVLAWLWKTDESDRASLLTSSGQPNNANNGNWGSMFLGFLRQMALLPNQ
jgi:mannan endo-1,4-beta-mannosidase